MMRTIVDGDLLEWEAWAVPGRQGTPSPGVIGYRCLTDPGLRPRVVAVGADRPEAEARLAEASERELKEWLARARPLR